MRLENRQLEATYTATDALVRRGGWPLGCGGPCLLTERCAALGSFSGGSGWREPPSGVYKPVKRSRAGLRGCGKHTWS